MLSAATGQITYATTNNFGFYTFNDLDVATFYVVTAFGTKRYSIANNERSFVLNDNLVNVDFLAENDNW